MWPRGDASPVEKLWISLLLKIVIVEVKIPMNGGEEARDGVSMLLEWCVNCSVYPGVPGELVFHPSLFRLRHKTDSFWHRHLTAQSESDRTLRTDDAP